MQYFREILKERFEISVRYDAADEAIWCYFDPADRPRCSLQMLTNILEVQKAVVAYFKHSSVREKFPIRYWVYASLSKNIFNYGGDLVYFEELIQKVDRETLLHYARVCIDIVYMAGTNFHLPITTIALVQGDALGGGFESMLAASITVVEKRSRMGFPEIKFNMFPGMGAYSFLARYHGINMAEEMMTNGKIYTAQELYEKGIISELVEDGNGEESVRKFIKKHRQYLNGMQAIQSVQQIYKPLSYDELMKITELWVDTALHISDRDLKTMRRIVLAQNMKKINSNKIRTYQDRRVVSDISFPLVDSRGEKVYHDRRNGKDRRLVS